MTETLKKVNRLKSFNIWNNIITFSLIQLTGISRVHEQLLSTASLSFLSKKPIYTKQVLKSQSTQESVLPKYKNYVPGFLIILWTIWCLDTGINQGTKIDDLSAWVHYGVVTVTKSELSVHNVQCRAGYSLINLKFIQKPPRNSELLIFVWAKKL